MKDKIRRQDGHAKRPAWDRFTLEGWAWIGFGILALCIGIGIVAMRPDTCKGVCVDLQAREQMAESGYTELR